MQEKYVKILGDAQEFLDNTDADEFINTFLELQDIYQGGITIDEFLNTCLIIQEEND